MVIYRTRLAATMPLTHAVPGAPGGWQASGALAPINPFTNDVPGTRTWSPPA
jgi:hypothetical protein